MVEAFVIVAVCVVGGGLAHLSKLLLSKLTVLESITRHQSDNHLTHIEAYTHTSAKLLEAMVGEQAKTNSFLKDIVNASAAKN